MMISEMTMQFGIALTIIGLSVLYFTIGLMITKVVSQKFKSYMLDQLIDPMWQNFVFVCLLLFWPIFVVLSIITIVFTNARKVLNHE